jgi:hypothetical protein
MGEDRFTLLIVGENDFGINPDRSFAVSDPHFAEKRAYMANRDARPALTQTECGACTDWTT